MIIDAQLQLQLLNPKSYQPANYASDQWEVRSSPINKAITAFDDDCRAQGIFKLKVEG